MANKKKSVRELVDKLGLKPERIKAFKAGDSVDVHVKIVEGEKERIQIFSGIVIAIKGHGTNESFTVRRLVGNEGVERVWPLHTPSIDKIELKKSGKVRRAKLYYLRDRVGKATRVAEMTGEGAAVKPRQKAASAVKKDKEVKTETKA